MDKGFVICSPRLPSGQVQVESGDQIGVRRGAVKILSNSKLYPFGISQLVISLKCSSLAFKGGSRRYHSKACLWLQNSSNVLFL